MSKGKTNPHKKALYASYKARNIAGKNKERRLLAHIARHPNDKVADKAVGNVYSGKVKPRVKGTKRRIDIEFEKIWNRMLKVSAFAGKKKQKRGKKLIQSALESAIK